MLVGGAYPSQREQVVPSLEVRVSSDPGKWGGERQGWRGQEGPDLIPEQQGAQPEASVKTWQGWQLALYWLILPPEKDRKDHSSDPQSQGWDRE